MVNKYQAPSPTGGCFHSNGDSVALPVSTPDFCSNAESSPDVW